MTKAMNETNKKRKKRRRSYGRVYRRPGGKGWLVQIPDPSGRKAPSGRTAILTRSVESKAEGEALLRELRKATIAGTLAPSRPEPQTTDLTVLEAIDQYLGSMRAAGRKESSIQMSGYSRTVIARNGIGKRRVVDVTAADIEAYMTWRTTHVWKTVRRAGEQPRAVAVRGGRASPATVSRDRALLGAAFRRLERMGELERNVVTQVPKPKRRKRQRAALNKDEVRRLLTACDRFLRPVVLTMLYTGARKGEILRLHWRDIDFESRRISLYRPKTGNASMLPLHPALAEELAALKDERGAKDNDPIFPSRLGGPIKNIKTGFASAVKRAGLADRGVTPHVLRHTFAVHFLEGGAAVTDLQAILGHASLETTQIYAQMVDARTRASVDAMDFGRQPHPSNQ